MYHLLSSMCYAEFTIKIHYEENKRDKLWKIYCYEDLIHHRADVASRRKKINTWEEKIQRNYSGRKILGFRGCLRG